MLYLIDGSSQMYRAYHAPVRTAEGGLLRNAQGTPTNAVYIFVNMLRKLLNEHKPEFIAASFDLPGRTFRDDLVDDYKANRTPMPSELAQQIPMVHAACEALGVPILTSERYEADDVIGTLALKAAAAGFEVAIVTMDKDFFQLVGGNIRVYNPRDEGTWYDTEGVKEKFGVAPDHVVDVLALMGDTIDNIKGVPGVGEKGARELIVQYGSLENLLAHAAEVKNKRYREGLLGNMEAARQSRELATIRIDVPVEFDAEQVRYRAGSREAAFAIFNELGFRALAKEYAPTADTIAKTYRIVNTADGVRALAERLRAGKRFAFRVLPDGGTAMRASIVGISFSTSPRDGDYIPIGHRGLDNTESLPLATALEVLKPLFEDEAIQKDGHDLKFDAIVLARHGVTLRGLDTDTMLASYLLDATRSAHLIEDLALEHTSYKALSAEDVCGRGAKAISLADVPVEAAVVYAAERADLVGQLAPTLRDLLAKEELTGVYHTLELPLVPVLMAIERAGVRVDTALLAQQSQKVDQELAQRSATIFGMAGGEFNINSPKQLSEILFDKLQLPVLKRTGASKAPSTAVEVLEELALTHDIPRQILEWRQLMKLKGTYIDALPLLVHPQTGRVHTCFNQAVASTGRLSSSDPNLQNIPIRTPLGREIRRAFIADPGNVLDLRRLFADRVPRPRASLRGAGAGGRVSRRGRLPRAHGGEDLRQRLGKGSARAAQHREDGQLRAALRQGRVHAGQGHRRHAAGGAGVHRRLLRRLPESPGVHRSHARRGARHRRGEDDVREAAAGAGAEQPRLPAPRRIGARGGQHADSGQRRRHPQARDDRRPRCTAPAP